MKIYANAKDLWAISMTKDRETVERHSSRTTAFQCGCCFLQQGRAYLSEFLVDDTELEVVTDDMFIKSDDKPRSLKTVDIWQSKD